MAIPRRNAYSPRSAGWTLYKPDKLADRLGLSVDDVDKALEETGFNKAVRVRESLIKWKTGLLDEQKEIHKQRQALQKQIRIVAQREKEISEMLIQIRNILRLPREAGE